MTELCANCNSKATISVSYTKNRYCAKHFYKLIEKRVRKDLRVNQPLDTKKKYVIISNEKNKILAHFCLNLLKNIFSERLNIIISKKNKEKIIEIQPLLLEEITSKQFELFLTNKLKKSKIITPLRTVSIEDIKILLPDKRIKFEKVNELLLNLKKKQPSTFFSIQNSFEYLLNQNQTEKQIRNEN